MQDTFTLSFRNIPQTVETIDKTVHHDEGMELDSRVFLR